MRNAHPVSAPRAGVLTGAVNAGAVNAGARPVNAPEASQTGELRQDSLPALSELMARHASASPASNGESVQDHRVSASSANNSENVQAICASASPTSDSENVQGT